MPVDAGLKTFVSRIVLVVGAIVSSVLVALIASGCGRTAAPPISAAPPQIPTARQAVNTITGNARGSRDEARTLRREADAKLAARDYEGAMRLRWQMLGIRGGDVSPLGALTGYAIQSLALDDLAPVATHLDAPSCRKYAAQLADLDARSPSYTPVLQAKKKSELQFLAQLTRNAGEWQKTIGALGFSPQEKAELRQTSVAQIRANIENLYNERIRNAARPWPDSLKPSPVALDPYTRIHASPSRMQRFFSVKTKTQRLLIVAALRQRADALQKRARSVADLKDPFGRGPFKQKAGTIYSIGPDAKDNGGAWVPFPNRVQLSEQGDIPAPNF